jgi:AraC family transcriptional regulator
LKMSLMRDEGGSRTPRNTPQPASHMPATLRSVVRLLAEARKALSNNRHQANQCIARAEAILQAESAAREMDVRNATGSRRQQLAPWQVARVVRFVDNHLSEKMPISTLATIARLSSGHFARAFRITVGESPHAYVIRRRIECAQDLILSTSTPLAEIALDSGFGDQAHMTKFFRRIVGVSPSVWRRAHGPAVCDCYETGPRGQPSPRHTLADTDEMEVACDHG